MSNIGIICDLQYSRHHLFRSYYYSVRNIYGEPKLVNSANDLEGVELLFIGDDHYGPHKQVWNQPEFINACNKRRIKVVVMTNERILDSFFPWNKELFISLRRFDNLVHYANDVDDCKKLGLRLNRTAMSKSYVDNIPIAIKKDKMVFIGKTSCKSYHERVQVLKEIQKEIEVDIINSDIPSWEDYLKIIANYRFVFSPIGNGNFFPMRFYEALAVESIPVHQVRSDTLTYYDWEATFDDCIYFEKSAELKEKIINFTLKKSHNLIWMEDNLKARLREDKLV